LHSDGLHCSEISSAETQAVVQAVLAVTNAQLRCTNHTQLKALRTENNSSLATDTAGHVHLIIGDLHSYTTRIMSWLATVPYPRSSLHQFPPHSSLSI
jgi:hypothetical protein